MKRWIGVAIALSLSHVFAGVPGLAAMEGEQPAIASPQPTPIDRIWDGIATARQLAAANRTPERSRSWMRCWRWRDPWKMRRRETRF